MPPHRSSIFLDRFRLRRSLFVGTIFTLAFYALLTPQEALSLGMLVALAVDATLFSGPHGRWTSSKPRPFLTMKGFMPVC